MAYKSHKWRRNKKGEVRCVKCRRWLPVEQIRPRSARPVCLECCKVWTFNRPSDPSQEDIAAACEQIQLEWTEAERLHRAGLIRAPWEAPEYLRPGGRRFKDGGKTKL